MSTFTVQLDDRTSQALHHAAIRRNRREEDLISEFLERLFVSVLDLGSPDDPAEDTYSAADIEAVEEGIAQLRRGESVPHDVVVAEMRAKFGR